MPVFLRQNGQSVDEENPPNREETCFPELIDPFSPSLAVQIKSYRRQRSKRILSAGDVSDISSQSVQEPAPEEESNLENDLPCNRSSFGSERVASLCNQNCGEAPVEHDRGRRSDKGPFLPTPRRCNSACRREAGEARDDKTINQGANQAGKSGNGHSTLKEAYASSSTPASPPSTPANSRPSSIVLQQSPFTFPGGIPSRCFLPQQNEPPRFSFAPTTIPKEEPLKIRIYVLIVHVILPQIYLHCLLRVPYLYLSRVHEIFQDSRITLKDFENLTLMDGVERGEKGSMSDFSESSKQSYARMKANWEMFIDGLMREWKTFNIISGLLLSGILSIFQAEGANAEAITRYAALCSLICALISLIYGCFFIIRFGSMRRVSRGVEWAFASCSDQSLIWNVYVLLAMPIIWLIWSIIAFIVSIMAFMWRVRPGHDIKPVSENWDFTFRLFVCLVLGLGMAYAVLIISTLRHYGAEMDKSWDCRMKEFWNRRPCDNGSRRMRQPRRMSSTVAYVVPPSPSTTPSTNNAHAFERLPVCPASTSPQSQTLTSPTLVSPSPMSPGVSPKKRPLPTKIPRFPLQSRSSVDDGSPSPVVVPPTPTHLQSSANSYMDASLISNHTMSPVNEFQLLHTVPPPPSESLPLIIENTNERIPPSFSRRTEAIASPSNRDSRGGSPPIVDPLEMCNSARLHASPAAVITVDPPSVSKEPDIQLLPLVKPKLKPNVNSFEFGERLPWSTGGNRHLESDVSGRVPLSRPLNVHRSTSGMSSEFGREEYRTDVDAGGDSHLETHVSGCILLSQPPSAHGPTSSEMISEVRREEYRTDADVDAGGGRQINDNGKDGRHLSMAKVLNFSRGN